MQRKPMSGCHHPSVRELDKDLYFSMLLLMTQAICLRCILLPPFFHDLPVWSRACFWVVRIMLPSLHSLQLLCFAMFYAERKGGKKDSKTGNDCSSSKLGKDLAESRCSYFFLSSHFPIVFALHRVLMIKIIIGKQFWTFWLHSMFFQCPLEI